LIVALPFGENRILVKPCCARTAVRSVTTSGTRFQSRLNPNLRHGEAYASSISEIVVRKMSVKRSAMSDDDTLWKRKSRN